MKRRRDPEIAEVTALFQAETDKAWLVQVVCIGDKVASKLWFPKSLCDRTSTDTWEIPMWIAEKERLV